MLSKGKPNSISQEEVLKHVTESDILAYYLGIITIPCVINSPLRQDKKPSLGLYSLDGKRIFYKDFATNETGGTFQLLAKYWGLDFKQTLQKIHTDLIGSHKIGVRVTRPRSISMNTVKDSSDTRLECKVRDWKEYDLKYWESYGVTLPWLKWAEVYPISHYIIVKNRRRSVFAADKYAYVYVERKEGKTSLKVYQPFNREDFKWMNKNDRSVIALWTKIPETGDKVCICSSVKDALCLSCNLKIPAIALQGEAYGMSDTAIHELQRRFKKVYICLDNDTWGLRDAEKLSANTGFINIVLPSVDGAKDISDLFKTIGKDKFIKTIKPLFYDS